MKTPINPFITENGSLIVISSMSGNARVQMQEMLAQKFVD